ncbi:MAG: GIY-YIG nuclease family protein [Myxococcales bacterium]|nr:GIY-YIG nuclease family protein [Myxococcales bacterium]
MKRVARATPAAAETPWVVYIVRCRDGTLYTGIARDLARRLREHDEGRGARYTRGRGPVTLLYRELVATRGDALRREAAVKRLPLAAKRALAESPAATASRSRRPPPAGGAASGRRRRRAA